jgi:hypothetical protein
MATTITAKFNGRCNVCGGSVSAGEEIVWSKAEGARHPNCSNDQTAIDEAEVFTVHGTEGGRLGFQTNLAAWKKGDVIHNPKGEAGSTQRRKSAEIEQRVTTELGDDPAYSENPLFPCPSSVRDPEAVKKLSFTEYDRLRREASDNWRAAKKAIWAEYPETDGPEFFTLLRVVTHYTPVYDDGEGGGETDYTAYCRPSTDEEAAPRIAEIKRAEQAKEAREQLIAIARQIQGDGERPKDVDYPTEGEKIVLTKGHYQDNEWLIIAADYIWRILYNGRDGDDWSYNNFAGEIGDRVPFTQELADRIHTLQALRTGGQK